MLQVAIVGAGPYALSIAAHFRHRGIPYRIFGRPMDSWLTRMPKGMLLKSDGFASNIYGPDGNFTLKHFCAERQSEYSDTAIPVQLETFAAYGLAFQERLVPELEDRLVVSLDRSPDGFLLRIDNGEAVHTRRVVLAVGITHFDLVPANLAHLAPEFLSHSSCHHDLTSFRGRKIVVIGGGASAIDLAALLHQADAEVQLVARQASLKFHDRQSVDKPHFSWERIRRPQSGLGPGLRSRFFANAPGIFHYLPERLRLSIVRTQLGPSGGWFAKDMVMEKIPLLLGYTIAGAEAEDGQVRLYLRAADGTEREILAEQIIAATGYSVDLGRLTFLSEGIRSNVKTAGGAPVLSSSFESSLSGLYFAGIAAANSFGPVMRFAFGARFTARRLTQTMEKSLSRSRATSLAPAAVRTTK
jgi:thioredoxin reductase